MYIYYIEICVYVIYTHTPICTYTYISTHTHSTYILYRSVCPLVIQLYTIYNDVNAQIPSKCTVLNENFVFGVDNFDL
jgi:hypothetical protein